MRHRSNCRGALNTHVELELFFAAFWDIANYICAPIFMYLALLLSEIRYGVRQNLWGNVNQATPLF